MDPPATSSGLAHVWLLDYELELGLVIRRGPATGPTVADLITGPAAALSLLAGFQRLDPGDLLLTGTPGATALQAPPAVVAKMGDLLLPTTLKWRAFFSRQERNPAYLKAGDVITASHRQPGRRA